MKKILTVFTALLLCANLISECNAAESNNQQAQQFVEMTENKMAVNVQKQPLNECSNQVIIVKKNWFVLNI